MGGRAVGTDDVEISPAGYPWRLSKLAYREEDPVVAQRGVRARKIQPCRREEQRGAPQVSEEQ